jgi:hypothetical protein
LAPPVGKSSDGARAAVRFAVSIRGKSDQIAVRGVFNRFGQLILRPSGPRLPETIRSGPPIESKLSRRRARRCGGCSVVRLASEAFGFVHARRGKGPGRAGWVRASRPGPHPENPRIVLLIDSGTTWKESRVSGHPRYSAVTQFLRRSGGIRARDMGLVACRSETELDRKGWAGPGSSASSGSDIRDGPSIAVGPIAPKGPLSITFHEQVLLRRYDRRVVFDENTA